ncbi:MAG: transglutaminase domain-containing protein [bacterium]|jgi:hypothetical protein
MNRIIIMFFGFLLVFTAGHEGQSQNVPQAEKFYDLAVSIDPRLSEVDSEFEMAIVLRDHVYRYITLKGGLSTDFKDVYKLYEKVIHDPDTGLLCQGLSVIYMSLLKSFGIECRMISMFDTIEAPYNSHVSVEFNIDGKWYASDPSFNIMFEWDGDYLDWQTAREHLIYHKPIYWVSNQFELFEERKLENYYIGIDLLVRFMVVHPAPTDPSGQVFTAYRTLPEHWDGKIWVDKKSFCLQNCGIDSWYRRVVTMKPYIDLSEPSAVNSFLLY